MTLTLCGYQMVVSAEAGRSGQVTERTIGRALVRAQEAIDHILLGRSEPACSSLGGTGLTLPSL